MWGKCDICERKLTDADYDADDGLCTSCRLYREQEKLKGVYHPKSNLLRRNKMAMRKDGSGKGKGQSGGGGRGRNTGSGTKGGPGYGKGGGRGKGTGRRS